jgi:hypothetical protein
MTPTAAEIGIRQLYHYEPFESKYLEDALTRNRVHFSNPENFNDPWDSYPWFDPVGVKDPTCRARWVQFFEPLFQTLPADLRDAAPQAGWPQNSELLIKAIENMTASTRKIIAERWRIYCLTPHPDSPLMWSHYADKHNGICLEFDARDKVIGRAFQVVYSDAVPVLDGHSLTESEEIADKILLSKSSEWSCENEYRILARDSQADSEQLKVLKITDNDFLTLPSGALTAIVAGCRADLHRIKALVQKFAPNLNIKRAVRSPDRYKIYVEDYFD